MAGAVQATTAHGPVTLAGIRGAQRRVQSSEPNTAKADALSGSDRGAGPWNRRYAEPRYAQAKHLILAEVDGAREHAATMCCMRDQAALASAH